MAITLDGTAGITTPDLTDTSLTTGRVVYTTTSGNLTSSANLLYSGTDMTVYGLTVGRGVGAIATNTAVGASALGGGSQSGGFNAAFGYNALIANTTGTRAVAVGYEALKANTIGDRNHALGLGALATNTTGSFNTAVGASALATSNSDNNTAVGYWALVSASSGGNNTAVGFQAGNSNTTGAANVFLGYQAGYTQTTGGAGAGANTYLGYRAGYLATGYYNTFVGIQAGENSTGNGNTFIGSTGTYASGQSMTSGSNNTILGNFSGNNGSLDIRTASNYIVLSDGSGTPRGFFDNNGKFTIGTSASGVDRLLVNGPVKFGQASDTNAYIDFLGGTNYLGSTGTIRFTVNSGGVQLTSGATSWASASDERLKDIIEPITGAMAKVNTLRTVMGKYKTDAEGTRRPFLIAQDVIAVLPEAVDLVADTREGDETEYMSVRYTDTIPLLVAAIKELKAEFDAYKASHP